MKTEIAKIEQEDIQHIIYNVRGVQVMLDTDLAALFGVETRVINQAVKRTVAKFSERFMFRLSAEEWENIS